MKRSLFAELRRRNVFKAAAAYLALGWVVTQVTSTVAPPLHLPDWIVPVVVWIGVIGFPFVIMFSWIYELTPEGLKRESEVDRSASITHITSRRLDYMGISLLVLAIGLFVFDRFVPRRGEPAAASRAAQTLTVSSASTPSAASAAPAASDNSIAVLPFASLSEDKANAYFAEGIQDEILTRLAKIRALKVISRTSTQHYASSPDNLPVIAKQLNVANILEGSVQKAGNTVHITVQLIRAATDEHLWAESYNRKLDDIFGVEGEVAGAVAEQLKAQLSRAEQHALTDIPTRNAEAYDLYLRAIVFLSRSDDGVESAKNASAALEKAVQLDPAFASAWGTLSRAHAYCYWLAGGSASEKDAARHAMETATRLAPDALETLLAQGFHRYWVEHDYDGAKVIFVRVQTKWPNDSQSVVALAAIARRQGHWNESLELWQHAIALDPRNADVALDGANTARAMRDWATTRRLIDRVLDAAPTDKGALLRKTWLFQAAGQVDEAQKILDRMEIAPGDFLATWSFARNAVLKGSYAPAITLVAAQLVNTDQLDSADLGKFQNLLADLQRLSGDDQAAYRSYEQARATFQARLKVESGNIFDISSLALAEAGLGNRTEALADIQRAITLLPSSFDAYQGPTFEESLARLQARFSDKDAAIAGLRHLLAIPYFGALTPALLRLSPDFDNLRGDPRFQELAQATASSGADTAASAGKEAKHE